MTRPIFKEEYILTHDGKEVFRGAYFDCVRYIHTKHPYSLSYALQWGGYNLTLAPTK